MLNREDAGETPAQLFYVCHWKKQLFFHSVTACFILYITPLIFPCKSKFKNPSSKVQSRDFPGGAVLKNLPANAGNTGSSPGPGRSHMPRSN